MPPANSLWCSREREAQCSARHPAAAGRASGTAGLATGGRLIAVVVGIDEYVAVAIAPLHCAVNDAESIAGAIRQTHRAEQLDLTVLTTAGRGSALTEPTRHNIVSAVQRAAARAGPSDTVLFFFAGHGGMIDGHPCLFPCDLSLNEHETAPRPDAALRVEDLQTLSERSVCPRRVMFLDCCQRAFSSAETTRRCAPPTDFGADASLQWRTGLPVSSGLVQAFQHHPRGWSVLLACGPNEVSLEDPDWAGHGIFSHYLAVGLRGQADLDGDGVVSLAELCQFLAERVSAQAHAVLSGQTSASETPVPREQTPTLVWGGPIQFPLTRTLHEDRTAFRPRVFTLWWKYLGTRLPYQLPVEPMARYGTAGLYGLVLALVVACGLAEPETRSVLCWTSGIAIISTALWLAQFAFAGAANEVRWHAGGYATGSAILVWHTLLTIVFPIGLGGGWAPDVKPEAAFGLGVNLFLVLSLMVVFGCNALQSLIALADLVKRDKRVAAVRTFQQLKHRWMHADIDNTLAMVSAHPNVYHLLGWFCSLLLFGRVVLTLCLGTVDPQAELAATRDLAVVVLIQWQINWYAACYRRLTSILVPEN